MRDERLEERIRQRLQDHSVALDTDALWAEVAPRVKPPPRKRPSRITWIILTGGVFLILFGMLLTYSEQPASPSGKLAGGISLDSVPAAGAPDSAREATTATTTTEEAFETSSLRERERSGVIVEHTRLGTPPPALGPEEERRRRDAAAAQHKKDAQARKAKADSILAAKLARRDARLEREAVGERAGNGTRRKDRDVVTERERIAMARKAEREREQAIEKAREQSMAEHKRQEAARMAEEERLVMAAKEAERQRVLTAERAIAVEAERERLAAQEKVRRERLEKERIERSRLAARDAERQETARLQREAIANVVKPTKAERRAALLATKAMRKEQQRLARQAQLTARLATKQARREQQLARAELKRQRKLTRGEELATRKAAKALAKSARLAAKLARMADRIAAREARRAERLARRLARREARRLRRENNPIYWTAEPALAISAPMRSGANGDEKGLEALHLQALVGYHRKNGLSIRGGLAVSTVASKVEAVEKETRTVPRTAVIRIVRNADGTTTEETGTVDVSETTVTTVRYYNSLTSIDVPLLAGYTWRQGRFAWMAEAGPSFNLSSGGDAHVNSGSGFTAAGSDHFIGRRKGIGFLANLSAAYSLSEKNSLTLGLRAQSFGGAFESPEASSATRVTTVGLQVGYRIRF